MAQRAKAADKQTAIKKIVAVLKKRYKESPPREDLPVLESMIYSTCIENTSTAAGAALYDKLFETFHDLNEMRVSSVTELMELMPPEHAEHKAMQVRGVLQYVFEKNFTFEFEGIRKKTLEAAVKQLSKIRDLSAFVRNYTLHLALGAHVLPLDDHMTAAAIWLGLADPGSTPDTAGEALKSAVRKADAAAFCHLLRCLANDPAVGKEIRAQAASNGEFDLDTSHQRLTQLLERPNRKPKAAKPAKPAAKAAKPVKKTSAKPAKSAASKTVTKKKTKSRAAT